MNEVLLQNAVRLHQAGDLAGAARLYGAILAANPRHFQALYLLGFVHFQRGEFSDAERLIDESLRVNPQSPDAHYNRGCALQQLGRHEEALSSFERAVALKPDYDDAWTNRGATLLALRRPGDALHSFDRTLALKPFDKEALSNRGATLFEMKRYAEAATDYEALLTVDPSFPFSRGDAALCRAYCCNWKSLADDRARLHKDTQLGRPVLSPHASTLISDSSADQKICAEIWVQQRCPEAQSRLWRGERYDHDKIRVAYLSADFHSHATAYLAAGVFERHDRTRFEVSAISFGPDDGSEMRSRLRRAFDHFDDVLTRSDADVARMLKAMEVDIAVDLKGFTHGARPGIFALRSAPIQVNYLGHPGTMGAPYIDYIIADETVIPDGDDGFYSEKVVRLPGSYQPNDCSRAIADAIPRRSDEALPERGFVFCSFNSSYKITPEIFDVWMRLVKSVPGSVLWLLEDNEAAVSNLRREADARGVSPGRIVFAQRKRPAGHLARHRLADLFLDTLPCNAHTTASDALWSGLPVLTCTGRTFAGRVAASLLSAVGLPELITASLAEYETLATRLARDEPLLASLKAKLAKNRDSTSLFDTAAYTRNLEAAYIAMYEHHQRGDRPRAFNIKDQSLAMQ